MYLNYFEEYLHYSYLYFKKSSRFFCSFPWFSP